jgi:hypothetical protein
VHGASPDYTLGKDRYLARFVGKPPGSTKQRGEVARGYDPRRLVAARDKVTFVARYQIISFARF